MKATLAALALLAGCAHAPAIAVAPDGVTLFRANEGGDVSRCEPRESDAHEYDCVELHLHDVRDLPSERPHRPAWPATQ